MATSISRKPVPTRASLAFDEQGNMRSSDSDQKTPRSSFNKYAPVSNNGSARRGWRPLSLRKTTFFAFAFILLSCIVVFAALFAYSRSNQGILTVNTHLHYLWTYSPTLFFTIAGACWSRVVYRIHQMQPWRMMSEGRDSLPHALFVDYITPFTLVSLFRAIKARHLAVVTSLLTSIALLVVTILSTGLFDVEFVQIHKTAPITVLDTITGTDHDFSDVTASPDLTIYSIQNTNLSYPEGTSSNYAVPKLSYSGVSNATLSTSLDVFSSRLQCEVATLHVQNLSQTTNSGGLHNAPLFTYSLSTSDCLVTDQQAIGGYYLDYNYVADNFVFDDTYGNTGAVNCSNSGSGVQDTRLRVSVGLIHYNITWNGTYTDLQNNKTVSLPSSLSEIYQLVASTNLLCVPIYGLETANVTYTTSQSSRTRQVHVQNPNSTSSRPLDGVTSQDLTVAIISSIEGSNSVMDILYPSPNQNVITVNDPSQGQGGYFPVNPDAFFTTMTQQYPAANGSAKSTWFDADYLESASSIFYNSVAVQFASQKLRQPVQGAVSSGTVIATEPRLVVTPGVFYAMEVLLALCVLAALALAWPTSRSVTPIDPASIGGTTAMLSGDGELLAQFHGTGFYSLPELRNHLLSPQGGLVASKLQAFESERAGSEKPVASQKTATWWRPFVFRPALREFILIIPLLAIVVLEILLHYSQQHNGIASVGPNRHELYASRLVPAVVFATIHILLVSLTFNVSLIAPFAALRKGPSAAGIGLFDAPLARFPLHNLWLSARKQQLALFCSVISTTAAFFLVTVSSGLFVVTDYQLSSNLTQLTWFNASATNNDSAIHTVSTKYNLTEPIHYAEENGKVITHLISNSIIELNLSYPAWTYDDLALPQLVIPDTETTNLDNVVSVTAEVPALRTNMTCEVFKNDQVSVTYTGSWDVLSGLNYTYQIANFTYPRPAICDPDSPQLLQMQLPARLNTSEPGSVAALPVSEFNTVSYSGSYCPYLVAVYGYATDKAFVNQTVIMCEVGYEQVQSTVTLDLPNYLPSKDFPPTVNASTAKFVNSSDGGTEGGIDIPVFLASMFYSSVFYNNSATTYNGYALMDPFTTAMIYGAGGIPQEKIFLHDPEEYLIPRFKNLTGIMGAQYISYFYRSANPTLPHVGATLPSTLQTGPGYRLKQNATSTRILDALLALSSLFAAITVFTFRYRDLARAQLGSVAATLALVADSEFVQDLRGSITNRSQNNIGGEWTTERDALQSRAADIVQMEQKLATEGYQFSLGWWKDARTSLSSSTALSEFFNPTVPRRRWGIDVGRAE